MEVWIVKGDYGSWDDHGQTILKVFDSEKKALSFQDDYEKNPDIELSKTLYNKWIGIYDDYDEDDDESEPVKIEMTPSEKIIWETRQSELMDLQNFNYCIVEKYNVE